MCGASFLGCEQWVVFTWNTDSEPGGSRFRCFMSPEASTTGGSRSSSVSQSARHLPPPNPAQCPHHHCLATICSGPCSAPAPQVAQDSLCSDGHARVFRPHSPELRGEEPAGEWVRVRVALQQLCASLPHHVPAPGAPGLPCAVCGGLPRPLPSRSAPCPGWGWASGMGPVARKGSSLSYVISAWPSGAPSPTL